MTASATPRPIKVASYNMRKGIGTDRRRNPERILEVLREIDADVIALQEADRRFGTRAARHPARICSTSTATGRRSPSARRAASMGWHGNALLVRKSARGRRLRGDPPARARAARRGDGRLSASTAGALRVVGMHLDLSGLWRRRQAAAIIAPCRTPARTATRPC